VHRFRPAPANAFKKKEGELVDRLAADWSRQ